MTAGESGRPLVTVFCRAPVPGRTKTRLTPPLAPEDAAALSLALLLDVTDGVGDPAWDRAALAAEQAEVGPLCALLPAEVPVGVQGPGDLGARMARASVAVLDQGRSAAVIVGSDCPAATAGHVRAALRALRGGADAAVCPSADGGYGLIALSRPCPELFQRVPWSTPLVLERTRRRAGDAGIALAEVERLDDLDRPGDLPAAAAALRAGTAGARTRHLLYRLGYA